jgi:hypothetical protein
VVAPVQSHTPPKPEVNAHRPSSGWSSHFRHSCGAEVGSAPQGCAPGTGWLFQGCCRRGHVATSHSAPVFATSTTGMNANGLAMPAVTLGSTSVGRNSCRGQCSVNTVPSNVYWLVVEFSRPASSEKVAEKQSHRPTNCVLKSAGLMGAPVITRLPWSHREMSHLRSVSVSLPVAADLVASTRYGFDSWTAHTQEVRAAPAASTERMHLPNGPHVAA